MHLSPGVVGGLLRGPAVSESEGWHTSPHLDRGPTAHGLLTEPRAAELSLRH